MDVYTGSPIPDGKKSLAYHLTFQAPDKTLTDKQVHRQRHARLGPACVYPNLMCAVYDKPTRPVGVMLAQQH
ncbi:MAG: hypothetical protein ACOC9Z_07880 [Chloroflexota bacterium]